MKNSGDLRCLEELVNLYWNSIYAYFRGLGASQDEAMDLTQDFTCVVLLTRDLPAKVAEQGGRFRPYLKAAIRNYHADLGRRKQRRRKLHKTQSKERVLPEAADCLSPQAAFDREWAKAVTSRALDRVRDHFVNTERAEHWNAFERRVVAPAAFPSRVGVGSIAEDLNETPERVSSMIQTVKRRFETEVRDIVRDTVGSDEELRCECRHLLAMLD